MILGFDPGRDKCGLAVMSREGEILYHQVVRSQEAIAIIQKLSEQYAIEKIAMGNQTTAKQWKQLLSRNLPATVEIVLVDERYSSLQARDRYWQMYPPKGIGRLIPLGMRQPPRPVDDLVAILLIERYLQLGNRD